MRWCFYSLPADSMHTYRRVNNLLSAAHKKCIGAGGGTVVSCSRRGSGSHSGRLSGLQIQSLSSLWLVGRVGWWSAARDSFLPELQRPLMDLQSHVHENYQSCMFRAPACSSDSHTLPEAAPFVTEKGLWAGQTSGRSSIIVFARARGTEPQICFCFWSNTFSCPSAASLIPLCPSVLLPCLSEIPAMIWIRRSICFHGGRQKHPACPLHTRQTAALTAKQSPSTTTKKMQSGARSIISNFSCRKLI